MIMSKFLLPFGFMPFGIKPLKIAHVMHCINVCDAGIEQTDSMV